jgi:branched-chain amino acid transport system ATP-binding protein
MTRGADLGSEILILNSVSKAFGNFQAVNNVSFSIKPRVITSLIGPNGAGKTTLFNLITGHLLPDNGRILLQDFDITRLQPHERNKKGLSRSFQIVNIFPLLTVLENVQAAIISSMNRTFDILGVAKNVGRAEALQLLDIIGLSHQANSVASTLSYGDQRVMEIAVGLATKPQLLLLDEPTAGMAPEETRATAQLIKKLVDDFGITVLVVEHDMDIVFSISETIIVLHDGMLLAQGKPVDIRQNEIVQRVYLGEELDTEN